MHGHTEKPKLTLRRLLGRGYGDLAIDPGTSTALVYVHDGCIVVAEPSVVALDKGALEVRAIGHAARAMARKAPANIALLRPLRGEVVANDYALEALFAGCLDRAASVSPRAPASLPPDASVLEQLLFCCLDQGGWVPPRVVISVPVDATRCEKHAAAEAVRNAGARSVYPIEAPIAAAIGTGCRSRRQRVH